MSRSHGFAAALGAIALTLGTGTAVADPPAQRAEGIDIIVDCPGGGGTCVTTVDYTVANIGTDAAGPFDVQALLDPNQSVVVDRSLGGLPAGADQTVTISTPPGGNCFDPDCSITVTADSNEDVRECNENNNSLSETTGG